MGKTIAWRYRHRLGSPIYRSHIEICSKRYPDREVEGPAARMAHNDPDLLSANKRIINTGLELMGARTLQRIAAENDVRGHNTRAAATTGNP